MQRKILSIILATVMILGIIPTLSAVANPEINTLADYKTYRSVVTAETINVDGMLDEIYKNAQKITPSHWVVGSSDYVTFEAYTAVTLQGVYVWAEIKDGELDKSEDISAALDDKFQIYIKMSDGANLSWGWYDTDYNGKILKHEVMDEGDLEIPIAGGCEFSNIPLGDATYACVKLADGSGWRSETFIPFSVDIANLKNYEVSIGLQANHNSSGEANYSACCDKESVKSAWYGYGSYTSLRLVVMDDVPALENIAKRAVYAEGKSFVIDGKKDSFYSEHAKLTLYTTKTCANHTYRADYGTVYLAFDNSYIYVYYEEYDDDVINDTEKGRYDSIQTYYLFENNGDIKSGYFNIKVTPGQNSSYTHTGQHNGWPGSTVVGLKVKTAAVEGKADTYGVEYRLPLPDGEKAALAANGTLSVKLAFSTGEYCSDEMHNRDDLDSSKNELTYCAQAGCVSAAPNFWLYSNSNNGLTLPELVLSKEFTDETPGIIHGASLSLGSDITVNYYATIGATDVNNAYMKFTRNDNEYIAYPKRELGSYMYKFSFKGISPQCLGDNIKAELFVNGEVADTHDGYSARQNCVNLLSEPKYSSNVKMSNLIKSLLNYGAAAQRYARYRVNNLVNKDYEVALLDPEPSDSVKYFTAPISNDLKMTAVGVYFDSTNKIYVKFTAKSLVGVTVSMNGVPAPIEEFDKENNIYIAYSDSIPVSHFGITYNIVLSSGSAEQKATYSVNSYTYAKLTSANKAMVNLAKATYTYGDAAKKYVGLGDTIYKVMTYNDSDNNAPYKDRTDEIIKMIKDSNPDLVGMQEVQQAHAKGSSSPYVVGLPEYGVIYFDNGASPNGTHYNSELNHPAGSPILYRKDRFTLITSGQKWLSDTPDTASKYDESDYTRSVIYALLGDKTTGEEILFVNTHLDYVIAAQDKQVAKLIEMFDELYPNHRKIFTADWNFTPKSNAYAIMNQNGYTATEEMITNAYKPGTAPNLSYIDYCFVASSQYRTISYKVINDHQYSLTASDHYPVVSEIIATKTYQDIPLEDLAYKDPIYNDHDDGFVSDDDRVGF